MRGLPALLPDVLHVRQDFDINGHVVSVGHWLFSGSFIAASPPVLEALAAQWFVTCLPQYLAVMHSGAVATTCHLDLPTLSVVSDAPPNHGAWEGGQADNVALGWKWITQERGRRGWSLTYVPGVPDRFIDSNWRLNQTAWGNLLDSATHLLAQLRSLPDGAGGTTVPGTVHRERGGAPLPATVFAPFFGVVPTAKVVTIRRRIPSRGGLSPSA